MKIATFDLMPYDSRKSFYGKAKILENIETGDVFLQSYDTIVCGIVNGHFEKYWPGYSATTMRHINSFIYAYSHKADNITCQSSGKKFWEAMECKEAPVYPVDANYRVVCYY